MRVDYEASGAYQSAWIFDNSGKLVPRPENQLHRLVEWHLRDWAELHGITVVPEAQSAVGRLDFAFQALVNGAGIETICVEFKHAHSRALEHGLEVQLPKYMLQMNARYGVYVVLWFKCKHFPRPSRNTINSIAKRWTPQPLVSDDDEFGFLHKLLVTRCICDLGNIRTFMIDATAPIQASDK